VNEIGSLYTSDPMEAGMLKMLESIEAEHEAEGWGYPPVLGVVYRALIPEDVLHQQFEDAGLELPHEGLVDAYAFEAKRLFDFGDPNFAYRDEDPVVAMRLMSAALKVAPTKPPQPEHVQCWFFLAEAMLSVHKRFRRHERRARMVAAVDLADTVYGVIRFHDTGERVSDFGNVEFDGDLTDALRDLLQASIS
jgi:hypothetical protein